MKVCFALAAPVDILWPDKIKNKILMVWGKMVSKKKNPHQQFFKFICYTEATKLPRIFIKNYRHHSNSSQAPSSLLTKLSFHGSRGSLETNSPTPA